ncbi:hypothetical protein KAI87_10745 [Myxococcota bacterium]|nr:hypothetical protein [Myxococcota bacterium]
MINRNDEVQQLEVELKELKAAFDKYFMGIDRVAPLKLRDDLNKKINRFLTQVGNNTAKRFRAQSLKASYVSLNSYWTRTTKQIEEGTYYRDRQRLKHKNDLAEAAEVVKPPVAKAKEARPPARGNEAVDKLYKSFLTARSRVGQSSNISAEAFRENLRRQSETIKKRYNCERVEFKVALKDGKAVLKAIPKMKS